MNYIEFNKVYRFINERYAYVSLKFALKIVEFNYEVENGGSSNKRFSFTKLRWKLNKRIREQFFMKSTLQNNNWCYNILRYIQAYHVFKNLCTVMYVTRWHLKLGVNKILWDVSRYTFYFVHVYLPLTQSVKYLINSKNSLLL